MKKRNNYIDAEELQRELRAYKDTDKMSDRLGQMCIQLCDHILRHSNFRNYTEDLKEEMKSHALMLCVKYVHNCDAYKRTPKQCMNYCTTIVFNAFRQVLIKYYKRQNLMRELQLQYITMMAQYGIEIDSSYIDNFEERKVLTSES